MTQTIIESEIFSRPIEEALAAARAAGLLPARTTEQVWRPDPAPCSRRSACSPH